MRLIDADALKLDIMCVYGGNPKYLNWLNHAPTVEVMPIIRCNECARNENCFMYREAGDDNGYCAWAVKREK